MMSIRPITLLPWGRLALALVLGLPWTRAEAQPRRDLQARAPAARGNGNVSSNQVSRNVHASGNQVNRNVNIGNDIVVARPPVRGAVVVPVYPAYGPSVGTALAAGVVAGATAGVVAGAMAQSAPPPGAALAVGTRMGVLPSGCIVQPYGQMTYYRCGDAWVQGYMEGSRLVYVVVPAP